MSCVRAVYQDPRKRRRINLLAALASHASTHAVVPAENQLTTVLAWLLDGEQHLARELLTRATDGDKEAQDVLGAASVIGVRSQVRLPAKSTHLFVDLSFETEERGFQALVEAKLGAPFHSIKVAGTAYAQPDAYLLNWSQLSPEFEARVRRVGTLALSREPVGNQSLTRNGVRRLAPLSWRDIANLLTDARLIDDASGENLAVWRDLLGYLRAIAPEPNFRDLPSVRPVLDDALTRLVATHPLIFRSRQWSQRDDFVACTLRPSSSDDYLWLAATSADSRYRPARREAGIQLWVVSASLADGALADAGFPHIRDPAGYRVARRFLPHGDIPPDFDDAVGAVVAWLEQSVADLATCEALPFTLLS